MEKHVKRLISQLEKDKTVLALAFFGSYVRKEKYNDIDLCIFLKPGKYSSLSLSRKKLKYSIGGKYDVQIFQQLPLYIQEAVIKEGEVIYTADEGAMYDLYFAKFRELEFYRPIYENYLEGVANG